MPTVGAASTGILILMGNRILRRGSVAALIQAVDSVVDEEKRGRDAVRMLQGQFDLNDFSEQVRLLEKMGPLMETADEIPVAETLLNP